MKVSGCQDAKACSTPGIVCTGTKALDRNENGTARMDNPWAACADPLTSPSQTNTPETARA